MRKIDVIGVGIGVFLAGGALYWGLHLFGLDDISAGIWSQVIFVGGLLAWVGTYLTRALGRNMTYHQQLQDYEDAVLQKRLDALTPEELAALQAELDVEASATPADKVEKI
ncbi:MAG: DUF3007 family protein [Leptolyngbyaceae cyanobacterium SM1_1_3]|nr:DUF3007 family protein [Leptolyngbyaceae cyanobacterium SM1_1_3]NJM85196.1 DUF3007 family protein [Leptolyngbyaceae cyanobacterium RM2_2_21]NJN01723.1 DUF3007 family protein [Leptolyngbyaceae cyanobacterium RM1_1_2]NJO09386.1 DUF3007 family protein [Leptolyngbyaceae cyanobacterium SL_1_1]